MSNEAFNNYSENQIKDILNAELDLLYMSDPYPILSQMGYLTNERGVGYRGSNRTRIWFRDTIDGRSSERTPSAQFFLSSSGRWIFNDFGNPKPENIIGFVMKRLNLDFKNAFEFIISNMGHNSLFLEIINAKKKKSSKKINITEKIEAISILQQAKHDENIKKYDSNIKHRVTYVAGKIPRKEQEVLREWIRSRNLDPDNLPKEFYFIQGETIYTNNDGKESKKYKYGIGLLNGSVEDLKIIKNKVASNGYISLHKNSLNLEIGADIHFPPYEYTGKRVKSKVYGQSGITRIQSSLKEKIVPDIAIFESKMDYYAAHLAIDNLSDFTVYITNGVNGGKQVVEDIKTQPYHSSRIFIFNQNDIPSQKLAFKITQEVTCPNILMFKYKTNEEKKDINDILYKDPQTDKACLDLSRVICSKDFSFDPDVVIEYFSENKERDASQDTLANCQNSSRKL